MARSVLLMSPRHAVFVRHVHAHVRPPALTLVVDAPPSRLHFEVHGGAAGGIQSSIWVSVEQRKPASGGLQGKYSLLLDAGGLAVPVPAVDTPGEQLVLLSHTHADHCTGVPALAAARALCQGCTRVLMPGDPGRVRQALALSEALNDPCDGAVGSAWSYACEVNGVAPEHEEAGPAGRVVLPFATTHRVPSVG